MSEWLLFSANSAKFLQYHGENKLIFNVFLVLAHWNNSPRVDMLPHSDTLFRFRANKSLLFLLNTACLAEKQQMPMLLSFVWHDWGSNPRSVALKASMLTIRPLMRLICNWKQHRSYMKKIMKLSPFIFLLY